MSDTSYTSAMSDIGDMSDEHVTLRRTRSREAGEARR